MTGEALYRLLEEKFSAALSAAWDNDGAACLPEPEREIARVLVALDATDEAMTRAIDGGFDLLLTHHPLLFRGVRSLTPYDVVPAKLLKLARLAATVRELAGDVEVEIMPTRVIETVLA